MLLPINRERGVELLGTFVMGGIFAEFRSENLIFFCRDSEDRAGQGNGTSPRLGRPLPMLLRAKAFARRSLRRTSCDLRHASGWPLHLLSPAKASAEVFGAKHVATQDVHRETLCLCFHQREQRQRSSAPYLLQPKTCIRRPPWLSFH